MAKQWLESIKADLAELETETTKFYDRGNNSAGTRARAILQNIKKLCQDGRNEIQDARPTPKKRA